MSKTGQADGLGKRLILSSLLSSAVIIIIIATCTWIRLPQISYAHAITSQQAIELARIWISKLGYSPNGKVKRITHWNDAAAEQYFGQVYPKQQLELDKRYNAILCGLTVEFENPEAPGQILVSLSSEGVLSGFFAEMKSAAGQKRREANEEEHPSAISILNELGVETKGIQTGNALLESNGAIQKQLWLSEKLASINAVIENYFVYQDGKLIAFNRHLIGPPEWVSKYNLERSYNEALNGLPYALQAAVLVIGFICATYALLWRLGNWRFVAVMGGLGLLGALANVAGAMQAGNIAEPFAWVGTTLRDLLSIMGLALGAQFVYTRFTNPGSSLSLRLWDPKYTRFSLTLGMLLAIANTVWIVTYYASTVSAFGFYFPPIPWTAESVLGLPLSSLGGAILAAVKEELIWRVLVMGLCLRLSGKFWVANLVQASLWGFCHSFYQVEPAYARGIEVGTLGLVYGFVMRRWGLLPCLVWHFSYDALANDHAILIGSGKFKYQLEGILTLAPVLIPLFVSWCRSIPEAAPAEIGNSSADASTKAADNDPLSPAPAKDTQGSQFGFRGFLYSALIISLPLCVFLLPQYPVLRVSREKAVTSTKKAFLDYGLDLSEKNAAAKLKAGIDSSFFRFANDYGGADAVLKLLKITTAHSYIWDVKLYRDKQPSVCKASWDAFTGLQTDAEIPDDVAGQKMRKEDLSSLVSQYMSAHFPDMPRADLRMVAGKTIAHKSREDNDLTFSLNINELKEKLPALFVEFKFIGNKVSSANVYFNKTNQWQEKEDAARPKYLTQALYLALWVLMIVALWRSFSHIKVKPEDLRTALMIFVLSLPLLVLGAINMMLNGVLFEYDGSKPLACFLLGMINSAADLTAVALTLWWLLLLNALACIRYLYPEPKQQRLELSSPKSQAWCGILSGYLIYSSIVLASLVDQRWKTFADLSQAIPDLANVCAYANAVSPALHSILLPLLLGVPTASFAFVISTALCSFNFNRTARVVFALLILGWIGLNCCGRDFLADFVCSALAVALVFTVWQRMRNNLAMYLTASILISGDPFSSIAVGSRLIPAIGMANLLPNLIWLLPLLAFPLLCLKERFASFRKRS